MNLYPNDACPFCWHNYKPSQGEMGIATCSLVEMIEYAGGILDNNKTCNQCRVNYTSNLVCNYCIPGHPCSKHYAPVWNGHGQMNLEMHRLYMRNSPYCRYWQHRPENIGSWYGDQVKNYVDVLETLKRMTNDELVIQKIDHLCREVLKSYYTYRKTVLLRGLYSICTEHFAGIDKCARAVNKFYHTVVKKFDLDKMN